MAPIHRVSTGFLLSVWVSAASAFDYGAAPNPSVELGSYQTGWSPEQRLVFDVLAGELETYRVVIRYPDGFRFDGFDMLGPLNTPVGAYELDFNYDGVPERTVTLRSLGSDAALPT